MKKLLFLSLCLACFSCKKYYKCDCTMNVTYNDGSTVQTSLYKNNQSDYSAKMKKKQAEDACKHEAAAMESTFQALITNNGSVQADPNFTHHTSCTIN